jgi:hypothetical protein
MKKKKAKKTKTNVCSVCCGVSAKKSKSKTKCCPTSMTSRDRGSWNI